MSNSVVTPIRDSIAAINAQFVRAMRQGDAAAMAAVYTETGQLLPPNGELMTGKQAIEAFWQGALNLGIRGAQMETIEVESQGDLTFEVGTFVLETENGQAIDYGKYLVIWKLENGEWKWHRDIFNSSRPLPG